MSYIEQLYLGGRLGEESDGNALVFVHEKFLGFISISGRTTAGIGNTVSLGIMKQYREARKIFITIEKCK